jgi:hypothetical protein
MKMSFHKNYADYQRRLELFRMFERLGVFKFEMSQDEKWYGSGYFWPYS